MRRALIFVFTGVLVLSGCASKRSQADQEKRLAVIETRQSLSHSVKLLDSTALLRLIHHRHGKVLLLNLWATWCQPCVEEFPDLVKVAKEKSDIEVIGISIDYPDEMNSKVIPFLSKLRVPFQVYIAKFIKQEDFINAIDSNWNGAVPATYVFDRQGKQRLSMIGERNYKQFITELNRID